MSGTDVRTDLVEQVAVRHPLVAKLPQVVMRITNRQPRFESVLDDLVKPGLVR